MADQAEERQSSAEAVTSEEDKTNTSTASPGVADEQERWSKDEMNGDQGKINGQVPVQTDLNGDAPNGQGEDEDEEEGEKVGESAKDSCDDNDDDDDDGNDDDDDEEEERGDMGLTMKGWGDAGSETVVLASEFTGMRECGEQNDESSGDEGKDDVDFSDDYDDDNDDEDNEIFTDDVDNLYDAYKSVLATDSTDLDPLDTSVLEDPYADLPPICEDDELGTGELSKSTGDDSFSFGDSNAQTVLPAFSKNLHEAMKTSSGELRTDELLSSKVELVASAEFEVGVFEYDDADDNGNVSDTPDESGGTNVTEGKVAEVKDEETNMEDNDAGAVVAVARYDDVDSAEQLMTDLGDPDNKNFPNHIKNDKTYLSREGLPESKRNIEGKDETDLVALTMEPNQKSVPVTVRTVKKTIVVTSTKEEVTVISDGGKTDNPDKRADGIVDSENETDDTNIIIAPDIPDAEGTIESQEGSPSMSKECTETTEVENDETDEPTGSGSSTQDLRVEEHHVEQVTETLESSVMEEARTSLPEVEAGDSDENESQAMQLEVPESDLTTGNLEAESEECPEGFIEPQDADVGDLKFEVESQDSSPPEVLHTEAESPDMQLDDLQSVDVPKDLELKTSLGIELHGETKYDSGCESERSMPTASCRSGDDGSGQISESQYVDHGLGEVDNIKPEPSKDYPDFINTCEEKLKVHYVSCYAKEAPIDWFHVPNKPTHRIFTNINMIERNGRRHKQVLTFDLLNFKPGLRILIEGRAGMGKSTLTHRIAYDYGLGILLPLQKFKLVFVLDVLKWSRDQELHDVILEQAIQADAWGVGAEDVFEWMQNNPEDVIFFIDGLDEHPGFSASHSLLSLAQGELYRNSTVVFTSQPNRVFEISDCCQQIYVMQKFTDKQVGDFIDNFVEEKNLELDKLQLDVFAERNVTDFYKVPLHLALLCTLFQNDQISEKDPIPSTLTKLFDKVFVYTLRQLVADRRVDAQKELELSMFEDMAFVLTRLALSCLQDDVVSLSKNQLASEHEIDDDLLDEFIQYGLLEKVICRDAYFFPYKLFQEFLAAKFIAIEYFSAANSGQIGVDQDMKHVSELFELCWSCYADGYKYEDLCIFTSGLLNRDYNQFVEALCKQYREAPDHSARELCLSVACACISENASNRGFISSVVDSLAPKGDLSLNFSADDADGPYLLGISHMLAADKLPKLSLVNFNPNDVDALRSVAAALADTDRLRSLEIDFTYLDPTINGMPKQKDGTDDFSLIKQFAKSISTNSSIRDLGLRLNVDMMSLEGVEVISGLFLNILSDLKSLGVHVHFDHTSNYFQDRPIIKGSIGSYENLNILISRLAVFLENNSVLEKLELNGCFLHRDALPELKNKIINHKYLRAISLAGQEEGAPLHREGANALAEILLKKNFDEVSLDLNSFLTKKSDKYSLKDNRIKFDTVQFENELIIAKLLKAMQGNGNLKRVRFSCHQIDCDLLDHMADFVEDCISLTSLEISCEEMDDLFMLFLGCGILCSATLENLALHGKFDSGGATYLLVQSCVMSLSLKSVTLSGSFTQDCIDWLAVSLPNLNIQCTHPMTLALQGHMVEGETDSVLESIEQLKDCVLPLDLLLEADFK